MRWTYEVRPDLVPLLQQRYEWALQHHNLRMTEHWPTYHAAMRRQRWIAIGVACLGLAVAAVGWQLMPAMALAFAGLAVLSGLALIASFYLPKFRTWSRRAAGAVLEGVAERAYRDARRRAPYTIDYELDGAELTARATAVRIERYLDVRKAALVLHAPEMLFVYDRPRSLLPFRIIYAPPEQHAQLLALFQQCGVPRTELTGPTPGYTVPIPQARIH